MSKTRQETRLTVHIVAVAYDATVSAIARRDIATLIDDVIDNHGIPGEAYQFTETPESVQRVLEQLEDQTGYIFSYNTQEV